MCLLIFAGLYRNLAVIICRVNKVTNDTTAISKGGFLVKMVLATIEPNAIVTTKSKPDILEKDRNPKMRARAIKRI